ncbi:MAG: MnhB domain-containing protein [Thiotrichales bacterium]
MKHWRLWLVAGLCAALGIALLGAMWTLPEAPLRLADQVMQQLDASGVAHPVTAVLLNFRGYDTFLEIAVLMLALLGMLAAGVTPLHPRSITADPVLGTLARALAPLMVMVAGYLLWAGADRPGGAFQAGAVLAAAGVMLRLAGILPAWTLPGLGLRAALSAGFVIFLLVAAGGLAAGALLQYPPRWAGGLILLIEAGLTLSLGLILAGLFLAGPEAPRKGSGA